MKPLNFCLDYLLRHLYQNRFRAEGERIPFDIDRVILPELGLTNHHEFAGLIDILIEDGNAIKLSEPKKEWLDYYKDRILITPKGLHFLKQGGYREKRIWDIIKKVATTLNVLTLLIVAIISVTGDKKGSKKGNEKELNMSTDSVKCPEGKKSQSIYVDTIKNIIKRQDSVKKE